MSAVDAPPGVAFAGTAAGEFVSRRGARRLSRGVFYYVCFVSVLTLALARRHIHSQPGIEVLLAAPILFIGVGMLGFAVRRARLRVDADGIRWGWASYGFRMSPDRLSRVLVYDDAIAVTPTKGSTWYVSARDWARFEGVSHALRKAGIAHERKPGRAPLRARLQSFGIALDLLLVGNALGATLSLGVAFAL